MINENVKKLAEIFPAAIKDGQVDLEALRQELGEFEEVSREKYELIWPGKNLARQVANTDISGRILKYIPGDSQDKDTTKNIYIEADNLEALKLLRDDYSSRIKMIYIDPPYNTGNDFIYKDNYSMGKGFGEKNDAGRDKHDKHLEKNRQDGARFHSNWLNMMYPRLKVARDLLRDDGVIFISINEEELFNLKLIGDEIFGASNYLTAFTIKIRHEDRILKGDKDFHEVAEYLLLYRKSDAFVAVKRQKDNTSIEDYIYEIVEKIDKPEIREFDGRQVEMFKAGEYELLKKRPNAHLLKRINIRGALKEGNSSGRFYMAHLEQYSNQKGLLFKVPNIGADGLGYRYFMTPETERRANGDYFQGVPLNRKDTLEIPYPNFLDFEAEFNRVGYEGGVEFRNGKKPVGFIMKLMEIAGLKHDRESIVLDFFAGSSSTAHATMLMNAEDKGQRQYIMVQLPENLNISLQEAPGTARSAIEIAIRFLDSINKPHILTEIGKERIRRAGEQIKTEYFNQDGIENLDTGFKVFRIEDKK
jgi:adenine-specific DNA-methyltransferase